MLAETVAREVRLVVKVLRASTGRALADSTAQIEARA